MKEIFWSYGSGGFTFSAVFAAAGMALNAALGGFDKMLGALMAFMVLDFVLGFTSACKEKTVDSRVMLWGGVNKLLVLSLVLAGVSLWGAAGRGVQYYPVFSLSPLTGRALAGYLAYGGLVLLPLMMQTKEAIAWRFWSWKK